MEEVLKRTLFNWRFTLVCVEMIFGCLYMTKRPHFAYRLLAWVVYFAALDNGVLSALGLPLASNWLVLFGTVNLSYIVQFVISLLVLWLCFAEPFKTVLFYGTASYIIQHFYSCVANCLLCLNGERQTTGFLVLRIVLTIATIAGTYLIFSRRYKRGEISNLHNSFLIMFSLVTILIISVFNSLIRNFIPVYNFATYLYASIVSLLLLLLQFGFLEQTQREKEHEIMERLLEQQARQQRLSVENVAVINRKCHDLKHQIAALRQMTSREAQNESIAELEQAVMLYDTAVKTGNAALDALLTEKCFLAEQNGICFTVIADGGAVSFLKVEDLYLLLGNALDNAIEASCQLPNQEDRQISLRIERKNGMTAIMVENHYRGSEIRLREGLPVTTKRDKENHGYGTKSISYIVEKYNGHLTIDTKEHRYRLSILLF